MRKSSATRALYHRVALQTTKSLGDKMSEPDERAWLVAADMFSYLRILQRRHRGSLGGNEMEQARHRIGGLEQQILSNYDKQLAF